MRLADSDSRSAFWKTINMYRNRNSGRSEISKVTREAFYDVELGVPDNIDILLCDIFPVTRVDELDCPFTLVEYLLAVHSLNPKKSPGPDLIHNSILTS